MQTLYQVDALRDELTAAGTPAPEIIRQLAPACLGWPYVFGAWGEVCTPAGRKRRIRDEYPTIKSACQVLRDKNPKDTCEGCQWLPDGAPVRMYDCRGFTAWLLRQTGLDLTGGGATSQWNTTANWAQRGEISSMPDLVCCVFQRKDGKMLHTGMHLGGGRIIHCSHNVQEGKTTDRAWTHYGIPVGLYAPEDIPATHKTVRRGAQGEDVRQLQISLVSWGYDPGEPDGIFGKKTEAAVKAFQKAQGLTADGVCGPKTWAALTEDVTTYTVRATGVTWAQYKRILEVCPLAEAEKEVTANE